MKQNKRCKDERRKLAIERNHYLVIRKLTKENRIKNIIDNLKVKGRKISKKKSSTRK